MSLAGDGGPDLVIRNGTVVGPDAAVRADVVIAGLTTGSGAGGVIALIGLVGVIGVIVDSLS